MLDRFGFEPPVRIQTMRTQVRDLDYDTPPALSGAVTVSRAWAALQSNKAKSIPAIPVTNENGELYGMLSPSEIASYDMRTLSDSRVDKIPVFNLERPGRQDSERIRVSCRHDQRRGVHRPAAEQRKSSL